MAIYQTTAFKTFDEKFNKRNVAALALHLGINDSEYHEKLYPDTKRLQEIYEIARVDNISIARKFNKLTTTSNSKSDNQLLEFTLNTPNFISVDSKYYRLANHVSAIDGFYVILDEIENEIGCGFIVKKMFTGYINSNKSDQNIYIRKKEF